jgi:hypothetical protein
MAMGDVRPEASPHTLGYVVEDDAGCLFLLPPALLVQFRVAGRCAEHLARLMVGEDLTEPEAAVVQALLAAHGDSMPDPMVIATRRLRAWSVIR